MAAKRKRSVKTIAGAVSEDTIQKTVAQHLALRSRPDIYWFHTPNGGSRNLLEAVKLKAMGVKPGVPDLFFLFGGVAHFLELKAKRGRLAATQVAAKEMIERAGGRWAVAKSIDEALAQLEEWGVFMLRRPVCSTIPTAAASSSSATSKQPLKRAA